MFVDQADIEVLAGDGGNGSSSFRREKYIPHGGPDGGDGGRGGSVFLEAVAGVDTLLDMVGRHHWYATAGAHGMAKKMAGRDGDDLTIRVPPGTLVYDKDSALLIADLKEPGKRVKVAKGGRGGRGNIHFVTSVRQAPEYSEQGQKGQIRHIHLELRLIADVGLVGLPNAGKSTLLSRLSAARPKIADYPFTTLVPQLGIAELDADRRLVLADIPGLIEGASQGHGLGLDFLRHIERTRVIVHMVDIMPLDGRDPIKAYWEIRKELEAYSPKLAAKAEILVANKMDLAGASEALADLRTALPGRQIMAISAVAGTGMRPLLETIWQQVQKAPPAEPFLPAPLLIPPELEMMEVEPAKGAAPAAGMAAAPPEAVDAELAAEIEAMKADDERKGQYYTKRKTDVEKVPDEQPPITKPKPRVRASRPKTAGGKPNAKSPKAARPGPKTEAKRRKTTSQGQKTKDKRRKTMK